MGEVRLNNALYTGITLYYYIYMTNKEMIIKAKKVSEELVELIELRNIQLSYTNYSSLMRMLGFTDNEIDNIVSNNENTGYIIPHNVYYHPYNLDVAFYVVSVGFTDDTVICNGFWLSVNNAPEYRVIAQDTINIKNTEIKNWKKITSDYTIKT